MGIYEDIKSYERLLEYKDFDLLENYIEKRDFKQAYENLENNAFILVPYLTMYILNYHKFNNLVFRCEPLHHLEYVPKRYLYEVKDEDLVVYVSSNIKEIREDAFRYSSIKKLFIPKSVEKIGDNALCFKGEIQYGGSKQEFIDKFLGKSKCFLRTSGQQLICSDGILEIKR